VSHLVFGIVPPGLTFHCLAPFCDCPFPLPLSPRSLPFWVWKKHPSAGPPRCLRSSTVGGDRHEKIAVLRFSSCHFRFFFQIPLPSFPALYLDNWQIVFAFDSPSFFSTSYVPFQFNEIFSSQPLRRSLPPRKRPPPESVCWFFFSSFVIVWIT